MLYYRRLHILQEIFEDSRDDVKLEDAGMR